MKNDNPLFLFVLVDALGWEYIKDRSFMSDILPYRKKLTTLLGFSCAAIPSILSGKYPDEHGQWNLFYYSPETSPFHWTRFLPGFGGGLGERITRKVVEVAAKKISGLDGYFETYLVPLQLLHLFDISERGNIYKVGGLNSVPSIFDWMKEKKINYQAYNYRQGPDFNLVDKASADINKGNVDVSFIYLAQMDSYLHYKCNDEKYIDDKIKQYHEKLEKLYRTAKDTGRDVKMYVFSDHGMVPTTSTYDLISQIDKTRLKQPADFLAMYDSTMARFWCFSKKAKTTILEILGDIKDGRIMSEDELKKNHIWFEDSNYGEIVFLLKTGTLLEPSYMGRTAPAGMHGCHPDDPCCDAAIMSNCEFELIRKDITSIFYVMKNEIERYLL